MEKVIEKEKILEEMETIQHQACGAETSRASHPAWKT